MLGKKAPCPAATFACATRNAACAAERSGLFFSALSTSALSGCDPNMRHQSPGGIPANGKSLSSAGGGLGGDSLRWQRLCCVAADLGRWRSNEVRAYGATRDKRYRDNGTATAQQVSPKPKPPDRPPRPLNHTPNPGPWLCSRRLRRAEGRPRPPLNKIVSRTLFARRPVRHEPEPRRPDVAILQHLLFCFCNACLPALYFLTSDAVLPPGVPPTASAPPSDGQAPDTRAARLPRGPRTHLNRGRPKQPHRARYR